MRVEIQSQGFELTNRLSEYVTKRLAYALAHGDESILRVSVRLSDINGERGMPDKRCYIEVQLKNAPAVVIEDIEADLYLAIDRAGERAGRTLIRRLARRRELAFGLVEAPLDVLHGRRVDTQAEGSRP